MIVAKCDSLNAKKYYHGERVLKYEGKTPVWWVHSDGYGNREDAAYQFQRWAEEEESYIFDETNIAIELERYPNYTEEQWLEDNQWYVGPGFYRVYDDELIWQWSGDVYYDNEMTYTIEEEDMELRENTEIYKEIYKKGDEVTPQERKIIESVGGTVKERKTEDYHAFAFDINQKDSVGADVGESLVELLNNLGNYNNEGCLWYLGDIDKEYVFLD